MSTTPTRINLKPYRLLYWPFLLPVALLIALFNKISPVPFKIYALRVNRIGQMAGNQEELCCQLDLGLLPREFRVFIHRDRPCNTVLLDMQKRILPIRNAFLPLFDVCHKLGGLGVSSMEIERYLGQDWEQWVPRTPRHLSFSEAETTEAKRQCRELGIDPDAPFVPVLSRDISYLAHIKEPTDNDSYRNDDINTYIPAMEFLADNWKVVRMGSVVGTELNTVHPGIIDYSRSGKRSELLDVYLSAQCAFFLSCATGLDAIASCCFRRPVLYVNFLPVSNAPILKPGSILIPKKFWHRKERRYLKLSELIRSGAWDMLLPRHLDPLDIEIHTNSADEIHAVTEEMYARLQGTWTETEEDRENQKRFWSQYAKFSPNYKCVGLIGRDFLRENPNWME
ncbi:MAG: TIGR04372 family glycosyltransferase [Desulfovibrionaceae bacterium]|nr:TIGR04372 family glycosyltransferase [Desulfovibrionaceae bacterium]